MALRELLASFSIDTGQATKALNDTDKGISAVADRLGGLADAFFGGGLLKGMADFVGHQIELGSRINDLSEKLGVATGELQEFQLAAGLTGVDGESAAQALGFLNKNMGLAVLGNAEATQTFKALDVALKNSDGSVRELGDVIPELANSFAAMGSDQERTAQAMKIFGKSGAALLPLLKGGSKGLEEMHAKFIALGGGMSKEFVSAADKAGDEIDLLKFGLQNWKSEMTMAILPAVGHFATKLQTLLGGLIKITKETNLAKEAWGLLGVAGAGAGIKAAAGFAKLFGIVPKGNGGLLETLVSLGKFGAVTGVVAALGLGFEDLWTFMKGGDSIIGDLLTKFLGVEEATKFQQALNSAWESTVKSFDDALPALKEIGKMLLDIGVAVMPVVLKTFVESVKFIAAMVAGISGLVAAIIKIPEAISTGSFDPIGKAIDKAGNAVFGKGGIYDMSPSSKTADYGTAPGGFTTAPYVATSAVTGAIAPGAKAPVVHNAITTTINVQGATSPEVTARRVGDVITQAHLQHGAAAYGSE